MASWTSQRKEEEKERKKNKAVRALPGARKPQKKKYDKWMNLPGSKEYTKVKVRDERCADSANCSINADVHLLAIHGQAQAQTKSVASHLLFVLIRGSATAKQASRYKPRT